MSSILLIGVSSFLFSSFQYCRCIWLVLSLISSRLSLLTITSILMSNSSSYSNNNAYYRGINNENEIVSNDSSVMTNLSFSNSPFSLKAMSSSRGKLCTPRALLAVESLDSDNGIDYLPLTLKESIWSTSFRSNRVDIFLPTVSPVEICTLDRQNQYEQNQYETQRLNSSRTIGYASLKSNYDHFGEAQPKRLSYSLGSTQSFNSLNSAPITPESPTASNYKRIHTGSIGSPHLCLTFRTYKGTVFTVPPNSKFFVIKSYNILDVTSSFTHNIWTSTDLGNKRLNKASLRRTSVHWQQRQLRQGFSIFSGQLLGQVLWGL